MNCLRTVIAVLAMLVCPWRSTVLLAQGVETRVENAEVVYVEGNVVVMKFASGDVREFDLPDSSGFSVDGVMMAARELTPGMRLTGVMNTPAPPRWVDTVKIIDAGRVWKVLGSTLILTTAEGENRTYRVASGEKINVGGKEMAADKLRAGDMLTATVVVTREPPRTGIAPPRTILPPPLPPRVGVLLLDEGGNQATSSAAGHYGRWGTPAVIFLIMTFLTVLIVVQLTSYRRRET